MVTALCDRVQGGAGHRRYLRGGDSEKTVVKWRMAMKTIFGLFEQVAQAQTAVDALLADGFTEEEMNAIALEPTVKENVDIDLHRVDVQKSPEHGGVTVQGLAYLFG